MRRRFWRIAAALCSALAVTSVAGVMAPTTAMASETQGGDVYVYSNQNVIFKNCSVAVGQKLSGNLEFWLQGNVPWDKLGSAAKIKRTIRSRFPTMTGITFL